MALDKCELTRDQELELARSVVAGDRGALTRWQELLFEPLYRFVFYRVGGASEDTEEVVQETFVAALESLSRFRGRSSLHTWVCAIAKNRISRLRRQQSRERLARTLEEMDPVIEDMIAKLETQPLPDEALEREETEDMVGATMASLPPHYQDVLVDKYVHAHSVEDIARVRRRSPKAVESTLSRAREAFRKAFRILARGPGGAQTSA